MDAVDEAAGFEPRYQPVKCAETGQRPDLPALRSLIVTTVYFREMATGKSSAANPVLAPKQVASDGSRVDALIAQASPFAQPILSYLRAAVHEAAPDATEAIKWGRPFFTVQGTLVCYMAAFTKHCGFGFWSPEMTAMLKADGIDEPGAAGSLGRITALSDLPSRDHLLRYIRQAAENARAGNAGTSMASGRRASAKAPIPVPPEFTAALRESKAAEEMFGKLPSSCRREYLEWITSAKRPETRERRINDALGMLAAGKRFNEQYRSGGQGT